VRFPRTGESASFFPSSSAADPSVSVGTCARSRCFAFSFPPGMETSVPFYVPTPDQKRLFFLFEKRVFFRCLRKVLHLTPFFLPRERSSGLKVTVHNDRGLPLPPSFPPYSSGSRRAPVSPLAFFGKMGLNSRTTDEVFLPFSLFFQERLSFPLFPLTSMEINLFFSPE